MSTAFLLIIMALYAILVVCLVDAPWPAARAGRHPFVNETLTLLQIGEDMASVEFPATDYKRYRYDLYLADGYHSIDADEGHFCLYATDVTSPLLMTGLSIGEHTLWVKAVNRKS